MKRKPNVIEHNKCFFHHRFGVNTEEFDDCDACIVYNKCYNVKKHIENKVKESKWSKNPKWQRKELEIMERDDFMCISCQNTEKELHVHLSVPYEKEKNPWDYDDKELITLCEDCHTQLNTIIQDSLNKIMNLCRSIDSGSELYNTIHEIDGMNPAELRSVWQMIKILKEY
jgi:5-methylcytosine-specific restriction endonuclease McrA